MTTTRSASPLHDLILLLGIALATSACSSDEGSGGGDGAAGGATGGAGGATGELEGCDGATLLESPADPSQLGPWDVGVRTVKVGDLDVEIWYPAPKGSSVGATPATYDIRQWLPPEDVSKVTDAIHGPPQGLGGFRDLPIDDTHGPYPAVIHIHGGAAFRVAMAEQTVHWASRGFVVAAADHPGLFLGDTLAAASAGACTPGTAGQTVDSDVDALLAALTAPTGDLAFLAPSLDMSRVGIAGHSAGASAAAPMAGKPNVRIVMPLTTGVAVAPSPTLESVLILAGVADTVLSYSSNQAYYEASPSPKRLVGIDNAGHLAMTVLCGLRNPEGKDLVEIGKEVGICGMDLADFLWDCSPDHISQERGAEIINYATTAALEETLHCADRTAAFANLTAAYPEVGEFRED